MDEEVVLKKEYHWMILNIDEELVDPEPIGPYYDRIYLNSSRITDNQVALKNLREFIKAGGSGEFILLEKYSKDESYGR